MDKITTVLFALTLHSASADKACSKTQRQHLRNLLVNTDQQDPTKIDLTYFEDYFSRDDDEANGQCYTKKMKSCLFRNYSFTCDEYFPDRDPYGFRFNDYYDQSYLDMNVMSMENPCVPIDFVVGERGDWFEDCPSKSDRKIVSNDSEGDDYDEDLYEGEYSEDDYNVDEYYGYDDEYPPIVFLDENNYDDVVIDVEKEDGKEKVNEPEIDIQKINDNTELDDPIVPEVEILDEKVPIDNTSKGIETDETNESNILVQPEIESVSEEKSQILKPTQTISEENILRPTKTTLQNEKIPMNKERVVGRPSHSQKNRTDEKNNEKSSSSALCVSSSRWIVLVMLVQAVVFLN